VENVSAQLKSSSTLETFILTHMETNTYHGKLVNSTGKFIDWGKLVHSGGKRCYEKSLTVAQVGCFMLVEGLFTQVKRLFTQKKLNFCPATMFTEEESLFTVEIISHVLTLFMKHLPTLAGKSRQSCSSRRKVLKTQAAVAVISLFCQPKTGYSLTTPQNWWLLSRVQILRRLWKVLWIRA